MLQKIAKLINVKSIVTLVLLGVFAYLSISEAIAVKKFVDMFQICVLLGRQHFYSNHDAAACALELDVR